MVAVSHDLRVTIELTQALGQLTEGNQPRSLNVRNVPLVRLTDIDQHQVRALTIHLRPQLVWADLGTGIGRLRSYSTERLVVDELTDDRLRAADRAGRVLPELELPEAQLERVEQQQASHQRIPRTDDPLDRLQRLDAPNDARQHAEDTPFGAAGDQSGRRWLRV